MQNETQKKYSALCDKIIEYSFSMGQNAGDRLPAERRLCEMFGVSRSTVQHAIRILTERQMLKTVQGSGSYWTTVPKAKSHTVIPFVTTHHHNEVFFKYISGMENFCNANGAFLSIHITDSDIEREKIIIDELVDNGHNTIIVYTSVTDYVPDFYISHIKNGVKFVFLDHLPLGVCSDLVCSNNTEGGFAVTEALIKRGHKNILFFFDADKNSSSNERYYGYKAALSYYKIPFRKELVFNFSSLQYDFENTKNALEDLFCSDAPPTACITVDIGYMAEFYNLTNNMSWAPKSFETMLYDRYPTRTKNYYLNGVIQPFYDMGFAAAELAYERINGKKEPFITKTFPITF